MIGRALPKVPAGVAGWKWQDEGYLELADLDADEFNPGLTGTRTRGLLIRRNTGNGECAFLPPGVRLAPASRSRSGSKGSTTKKTAAPLMAPALIRWLVQEICRIATRLARQRIQPTHIIAWSLWRRTRQAAAQRSHLKQRMHGNARMSRCRMVRLRGRTSSSARARAALLHSETRGRLVRARVSMLGSVSQASIGDRTAACSRRSRVIAARAASASRVLSAAISASCAWPSGESTRGAENSKLIVGPT